MFTKAFDKDLKGYGGFQFKVGETYTTEQEHPWDWFNYADKASTMLCLYHKVRQQSFLPSRIMAVLSL